MSSAPISPLEGPNKQVSEKISSPIADASKNPLDPMERVKMEKRKQRERMLEKLQNYSDAYVS